MKVIIVYKKYGSLSYLGHLDFQGLWERIIRISQLPLEFTEGFHPMMKMNLLQPLSVGMEGQHEFLHLTLKQPIDRNQIERILAPILPDGLSIIKVSETKWTAKQYHQHKESVIFECTLRHPIPLLPELITAPIIDAKEVSPGKWRVVVTNTSQEQPNLSRLLLTRAPSVDIMTLKRVRLTYR